MSKLSLVAEKRDLKSKGYLSQQRKDKKIPSVVYGLKQDPVNISITESEFHKFMTAGNKNVLIDLDIDGSKECVLVKEYTRHPVRQYDITHIDFLRVEDSHPVVVKVPIRHHGTPTGVKNDGGQFQVMKRFVQIKCNPNSIPEAYDQNIDDLAAEQVIYARDIDVENGSMVTPAKTALYGVSKGRGKK
jgi:large subunit ribosomal protein L25